MSLEDNEMLDRAIDRALDAADAQVSEEVIQDTEAPEASETVEATEAPAEDKPSRERDETGKFKAKAATAPKEEISGQKANEEQTEAGKTAEVAPEATPEATEPPIEMPTFWPAEMKEAVAKTPREFQSMLANYEAQRTEWANRKANEAERGLAIEKRLYEDMGNDPEKVARHRAELQMQGVRDEIDELHRYRGWDKVFKTDVKAGISALMQKNGLTPQDFLQDESQQTGYYDPRVDEAIRDAQEAKKLAEQYRTEIEKERETQRTYALKSEIETFKDGKDSKGNIRRGYAELYAPQITQAADAIQRQYPSMQMTEVLNHAYEFVLGEVSKLYPTQSVKAPVKTQEQVIAETKKAKAAAVGTNGAPATGAAVPRRKAKSIDEAMDFAEEALGLR